MIRVAAVVTALLLSNAQFRFFDCNKMPVLSVAGGAVTLLVVYAICEVAYRVARSTRSTRDKLIAGGFVLAGGGGLVALTGFFTLMTHLCP